MMTLEEQAYVRKIEETIVKLEARTAELECRLNMNSSNSSKTLSRDKSSQKKRSLRKSLGKKPIVHADATGVRALVWTTWLHHVVHTNARTPISMSVKSTEEKLRNIGKTSISSYYCRLYRGYWQGLIYQG